MDKVDSQGRQPLLLLEVFAFAATELPHVGTREWTRATIRLQELHRDAWLHVERVIPPNRLLPMPEVSPVRLRAVHRELRRGLDVLFPVDDRPFWERRTWHTPIRSVRPALTRQHRRVGQVLEAHWPDTVWLTILSLMDAFGSKIRRCPMCPAHALFVKTKRQAYCSRQCSQRARSARWYQAHRALALQRRRAVYERHVLQGRKGRVARRPRKTR